ncbi:alpha/beta hydrolase [Amnibacterium sp. CER49]|uniref:alpha/beta fold hydrolase n=1 Tax=Amnibacterium sp. CER49 TaxID=3039161 RepID=UPI00244891EC|nr:alpha/beta hydrolase [Amnibacterium sp. CER49]MDH2443131.1 alpha/beta hydrolase [Amnibacterium sp. CER49]
MIDPDALGLTREVVATPLGPVVVRTGRRTGAVATVLLHGAAGSWTTWAPLLAADPTIPDVVAPDLPGWGESAAPARPADVEAVSSAVAGVARALGYERWTVLGHSLGGFVALDLAAREPGATVAVGLVSPTGAAVVDAIRRPLRGGLRLPWFAGMLLAMRALAALPRSGRGLLRLLARLGLLRPLAAPLFADVARVDEAVIAALADEIRPVPFLLATRAAAAYDLATWRRVRCPVRSVRGARDVFVGAGDGAALAALLPDGAELVLQGAGHFAAVERPDAVLRFLGPDRIVTERRE